MHRSRVSQIKETLKQAIRDTPFRGQTEVVATNEETLTVLENIIMFHADVKQILQQKGITINLVKKF